MSQHRRRARRTGTTIATAERAAADLETFIQKIIQAPRLELVLFVRDEFLYSMRWAELFRGREYRVIDQDRYKALNKALKTVPGMIYSLRDIVEQMLLSDAKAEIMEGGRTQNTFNMLSQYRDTINDMATGWWWHMCKQMNSRAHNGFGKKTTREQVIRATLMGMDMDALQAFVKEHQILVELVSGSSFKGLHDQNQILLDHADWIFSPVPEGAELTSHPGQHPGWKDQDAGRAYERTLARHKEESQWRRGFPRTTLGGNTVTTLTLLRLIADTEQEFMDEIGSPWLQIEGGAKLPESLNSLFTPEATTQAHQESA